MLNSRLGLFTAALQGFNTLNEHPFSRSYGVILPSSLTRVLSLTLGFSPRLPVSVCGTGTLHSLEAFLGSVKSDTSLLIFRSPSQLKLIVGGFAYQLASLLGRTIPSVRVTALLCHPIAHNGLRWYRNFNLLSFHYAFRPRVRSRLTLSGRAFLRNP